jgi:hypothetical protein
MRKPWRPLALAVVLSVIVGVGVASAQTIIVRQAPPGSTVEFVLNSTTVGSGTVNPGGDAVVPAAKGAAASKPQMDALIHVDVCGNVRRVIVVERGQVPNQKEPDCERNQVLGLFLIKPVSTIVVNVGGANPTVLLRQGSFSLTPPRTWSPPTGFVVFGGGSLTRFSNATALACGDAYIAAEAAYLRPSKPTASGSGTPYRFDSDLDAHVVTLVGKVGGPAGPVRLFGQFGTTYHRARVGTTQTMEETRVTIDGVEQTVPGGTQTYEIETDGWALTFGGGLEIWVQPSFALYAEAGRTALKGEPINDADGTMDEWITTLFVGARIHIGRNR